MSGITSEDEPALVPRRDGGPVEQRPAFHLSRLAISDVNRRGTWIRGRLGDKPDDRQQSRVKIGPLSQDLRFVH